MARECDLTGKRSLAAHKVSHSNIKTKRRQHVNLKTRRIFDPETGRTIKLRLSTSTIRTLDKMGPLSQLPKKIRNNSRS